MMQRCVTAPWSPLGVPAGCTWKQIQKNVRPVVETPVRGRSYVTPFGRSKARAHASKSKTPSAKEVAKEIEGASTDLNVILNRLKKLALPYWTTSEMAGEARWKLAGVVGLTLATTGVSVVFNYLGRDFFNAMSEKNAELFQLQLIKYLGGFVVGIPVFVFRSYYQSRLALEWREWMTRNLLQQYFRRRSFYQLQAKDLVDNPDQRISADVRVFTDTALSLSMTLLNALIDLVSFSGILYSIYPPLFAVLLAYSIGGTWISVTLGKPLVGLNFNQEAREADFRYNLVRVRENAESIAFYGGEGSETAQLVNRLKALVANYGDLLITSRNLDFFTSFYRFLVQLVPAATVAPLFFQGKIEFGVITQSQSAFNHILQDVSLVVYQFEALAEFSAVIDRLGEFQEVVLQEGGEGEGRPQEEGTEGAGPSAGALPLVGEAMATWGTSSWSEGEVDDRGDLELMEAAASSGGSMKGGSSNSSSSSSLSVLPSLGIDMVNLPGGSVQNGAQDPLLELQGVTITTPDGRLQLVQNLSLKVLPHQSLLIMGASGAGKTSVLRVIAGLWQAGSGQIVTYNIPGLGHEGCRPGGIMFLPQRPYMVLGSLRDQLLYPTWSQQKTEHSLASRESVSANRSASQTSTSPPTVPSSSPPPSDKESTAGAGGTPIPVPADALLEEVLHQVQLEKLLTRCREALTSANGSSASPLDHVADWSAMLSLGEQQRLAFARLLLTRPCLALMDEATSALDSRNEEIMYQALLQAGITCISVGHRSSLKRYHQQLLTIVPSNNGVPGAWNLTQLEEPKVVLPS